MGDPRSFVLSDFSLRALISELKKTFRRAALFAHLHFQLRDPFLFSINWKGLMSALWSIPKKDIIGLNCVLEVRKKNMKTSTRLVKLEENAICPPLDILISYCIQLLFIYLIFSEHLEASITCLLDFMSGRLASFRGPSTPTSSPVHGRQPSNPSSPSKQNLNETTYHRKVRSTLQELRNLTKTWDELIRVDGQKAATGLIDARTDLEYVDAT